GEDAGDGEPDGFVAGFEVGVGGRGARVFGGRVEVLGERGGEGGTAGGTTVTRVEGGGSHTVGKSLDSVVKWPQVPGRGQAGLGPRGARRGGRPGRGRARRRHKSAGRKGRGWWRRRRARGEADKR